MATTVPDTAEVELAIGGMTCASCAARIEKKLNRMEGVTATVNYATEKARVSYGGETTVRDLIATVEATGYTAQRPAPPDEPSQEEGPDELLPLRQRLVTAAVLAVPVVAMALSTLLEGYRSVRPLTSEEQAALPILARGAALRFTLTRAYDWLNTPAGALVTSKDPLAFARRLAFYADPANARVFA